MGNRTGPMRRGFLQAAALGLGCSFLPPLARAAENDPALVYDYGSKFDHSFNEAAYNGAVQFRRDTGHDFREIEINSESQRLQALLTLAKRGAGLIIGVGFGHRTAMDEAAARYPQSRFTLIDTILDRPNVQSVVFREEQGCYLVGMLAALVTKTGKLGFVGGMDTPIVRKFAGGFAQGARAARPDIEILETMIGATPAAWTDPARGAELARSQIDRGVDIIFAAAGASGLGVMQAAADAKILSIGVDSNQNGLHPGLVLTSMVKRVDRVVYNALLASAEQRWKPGVERLGLADDALGWALDANNRALISPEIEARVNAARADIIAGRIIPVDVTQ